MILWVVFHDISVIVLVVVTPSNPHMEEGEREDVISMLLR
jgi:hypothetical protein